MNQKIAFITAIIPKYKVWLYEELGRIYDDQFFAFHGAERKNTVPKDIAKFQVKNNIRLKVRYLFIKGIDFIWIPVVTWIFRNRPKVIILQDGVRVLSNYFIHFYSRFYGGKVFYYSHGYNHQASLTRNGIIARITERIRKFLLKKANGILVYTLNGKKYLEKEGIKKPIYVSNNTLDTHNILAFYKSIKHDDLEQERSELGLSADDFVITFLGRLVEEKRVDHVIEIIRYLNNKMNFKVTGLIIGDGPLRKTLEEQAKDLPIIFTGYKAGESMRKKLILSSLIYLPGMVGLAIIEALCAGKPLVTVNHSYHSPEIEYLQDDKNGLLMEEFSLEEESERMIRLLKNKNKLEEMSENAKRTALEECSSDIMLKAFVDSIEDAFSNRV